MNTPFKNWKILLLVAFFTVVLAVGASADMGRGYGYRSQMHHGLGWQRSGCAAPGSGA